MTTPEFETILYSVDEGIATITLNRPEKLNAFTARMMMELIAAFDLTDADDAVKAVIVTGSGPSVLRRRRSLPRRLDLRPRRQSRSGTHGGAV